MTASTKLRGRSAPFYDRSLIDIAKGWRMVVLGTLWSYVLDAPAIFGFIATAGIWIC
jgi:hypothetical protein